MDHNDTLTQADWTRRAHAAILAAQLIEDSQASRPRNNGTDPRKILADAIRTLERSRKGQTLFTRARPHFFASLPVGHLTGERIDRPKTGDFRAAERRQIVAQGERSPSTLLRAVSLSNGEPWD